MDWRAPSGITGTAAMSCQPGPPHSAVARTDAALVHGVGDDDMAGRREMMVFGKVGDTVVAARLLVRHGEKLDAAG